MTWIHSCVAIDSSLNHLTVVVNGQQLEDKAFPIPPGAEPPSSLTENFLMFKNYIGLWYQSNCKVSNLNVFSKLMPLPEMVRRTAGDDCGKADGDYLSWESAEWILKGKVSLGEVTVEDLCRQESRIQVFTSQTAGLNQCMNLCEKMQNGTMATVRSPNESKKMFDRMIEVLKTPTGGRNEAGMTSQASWTPITPGSDGSWVDVYNKSPPKDIPWANGQPGAEQCAIFVVVWKGLGSFSCDVNINVSPIYCSCHFPVR